MTQQHWDIRVVISIHASCICKVQLLSNLILFCCFVLLGEKKGMINLVFFCGFPRKEHYCFTSIYVNTPICIYKLIYIYKNMHVYLRFFLHTYLYKCVNMYPYVYISVCVYTWSMYINRKLLFRKWKILLLNVESWNEVSVTTGRNCILFGGKKTPRQIPELNLVFLSPDWAKLRIIV